MQGVVEGFATIGVVIVIGFLLGHFRLIDLAGQVMLSRLTFFVAGPALLVTVLSQAVVADVFSRNLVASLSAVVAVGTTYVLLARLVWRKDLADTVMGMLSAVFVNAANLGIPIATYVLGDASLIVPMLLIQMIVIQPVALTILDRAAARSRRSIWRTLAAPLTNPLTLAAMVGLVLAVTPLELPVVVAAPLGVLAGLAVPAMLIAYGVSLRLGPRPGSGSARGEVAVIAGLKLALQPLVAFTVARFALGLEGTALLAVTVIAALPTAQNIFIHATRYDRSVVVVRDAIFVTTLASAPVVFAIAGLLT